MKSSKLLRTITGLMIYTSIITTTAWAAHPELAKLGQIKFNAPGVSRYTLDNGLVVYIVKDNTLPIIHMSAFTKAGNAYDAHDKIGTSQMTAMLLKDGGTVKYKAEDIDKTLEYLGASIESNSYSEETRTEMTVMKKDLDRVLDIYSDVLRNPAFEEEKVKIARDEELEVLRRRNDKPGDSVVREAKRRFFGAEHPYGWRTEESTINSITREDMAGFHSAYFKPNNIILAISGDFPSNEEMLAKINDKFGGWRSAPVTPPAIPAPQPLKGRKIYFIDKDVSQAFMVVMQKGIDHVDPDNYPLAVLTEILGGGFQSRMFTEIRTKKGLAYTVYTAVSRRKNGGFNFSYCGTKPETYSLALSEILRQLELIGKEPVSKDEIAKSKESIINPFVFKFSTPHKLAVERALEEFYGQKKGYIDNYVADISKTDPAQALSVGKKYYDPADALIFVIGNSKKFDKPLSEFGPVTELKEN